MPQSRRVFIGGAGAMLASSAASMAQTVLGPLPADKDERDREIARREQLYQEYRRKNKGTTSELQTLETDLQFEGHRSYVNWISFSKDGAHIYSKGRDGLASWDPATARQNFVLEARTRDEKELGIVFDEDVQRIICSPWSESVRLVIDLKGRRVATVKRPLSSNYLWLDKKRNAYLALSADHGRKQTDVSLFHRDDFSSIGRVPIGFEWSSYTPMRFSSDGSRFFGFSNEGSGGAISGWDFAKRGRLPRFFGHRANITSMHLSPDDRVLLTAGFDGVIKSWDCATGKEIASRNYAQHHPLRGAPTVQAVSPDFKLAAIGNGPLFLVEIESGTVLKQLPGLDTAYGQNVTACAFSPDGKRIVAGSMGGRMVGWTIT